MYIYPAFNTLEALHLVPNAQLVSAHIPRRAARCPLPVSIDIETSCLMESHVYAKLYL